MYCVIRGVEVRGYNARRWLSLRALDAVTCIIGNMFLGVPSGCPAVRCPYFA